MIRLNKHMAISIGDRDGRLISMGDELFHLNIRECYRIFGVESGALF